MKPRPLIRLIALCAALVLLPLPAAAEGPEIVTVDLTGGSAPIAENQSLDTYTGIAVEGTLTAVDPDGDALTYELVTGPKKGTLTLEESGRFTYTPARRRGRDTFSFTARDVWGNISNVGRVTVTVSRRRTAVSYSDTAGTGAAAAAQYLAETGIYVGEQVGGVWLFRPEAIVDRGTFLAMCLALCGEDGGTADEGDTGDMPDWLRPVYAAASAMDVPAASGEGGLDPACPLTGREAAILLDGVLDLTDVRLAEDAGPDAQAAANAAACGLFDPDAPDTPVTMGEAAVLLARAGAILDRRG